MSLENVFEVSSCEVCGSTDLQPVLNLGYQPLCDDLVPINVEAKVQTYPIDLLYCPNCKTVHQKYQVEKTVLFPKTYHYRSGLTQNVLDGMKELVELVNDRFESLEGKRVLDIGCNDGSLLDAFAQKGCVTFGVEPTDAGKDASEKGHAVLNGYFGTEIIPEYLKKYDKPDIITFTNVFAHIQDLKDVTSALRQLSTDDTVIVIENHYLGAVLDKYQFDTFYHEHPRTYSYQSFKYIAQQLGMYINSVDFPSRYNGNIRVIMSKSQQSHTLNEPNEDHFEKQFAAMKLHAETQKSALHKQLEELIQKYGPIPAKAFPGRAAVLIHYFGLNEKHISAAYEKSGSPKIGHFVPGTRIPIRDEAEFFTESQSSVILNLAWHIKEEINHYMRNKGYDGTILEVYS